MPGFATGVAKRLILAPETTFGVSPVTGGKYLRRISSDLTLNKDSYESQEILVSQQVQDARHGVRRPQGTLSGQLSPGSFPDIFQGIMRGLYAAGVTMSGATLALDTTAGTLTLSGGGFVAAGLKREDVIRISGAGSPNTALNGRNLRINSMSDTVITTRDLPTGLTSGSLTSVGVAVVGAKLIMPATAQVYHSYSIEHFFSDIGQSELFIGCRFGQTGIAMPSTGLVTFNTQIMGVDMVAASSQQLTSPSGPSTSSSLAAVNGKLSYNNTDLAIITGLNITISPALEAPAVVGSNTVPWIFQGRMRVGGNFTALFLDQTLANTFINEVEVALSVMLTAGSGTSPDFIRLTLPRIKAMSDQKSDGEMSLVQSMAFTGLQNVSDTTIDATTLIVQDSTLGTLTA